VLIQLKIRPATALLSRWASDPIGRNAPSGGIRAISPPWRVGRKPTLPLHWERQQRRGCVRIQYRASCWPQNEPIQCGWFRWHALSAGWQPVPRSR